MSKNRISIRKQQGNKGVIIIDDNFDTTLYIAKNDYQWLGNSVDETTLVMIRDAINEFLGKKEGK